MEHRTGPRISPTSEFVAMPRGRFSHHLAITLLVTGLCLPMAASLAVETDLSSSTSSITLTPDEQTVCAVNQDSGSISLWNWSGDETVREIKVGAEPRTLAVSPDGQTLVVVNQRSETLDVVDLANDRVATTIDLGGQPYGVILSPDGSRAFVSKYAGGYLDGTYHAGLIAEVALGSGKPARQVPVKPRPWAMALTGDGRSLYATHYLHVGGKGIVTELDPQTLAVRREVQFEEDPDVAGGRGGVFNALAGIAVHPNGRRVLVAGMHANTRRGLALSGRALSHKTTVQAALRVFDREAGRELFDARIISSFSGQAVAVPVAVAFIGDTEHFIDVYFASNDMKVLKYNEKGYVSERALLELPAGPTGVAVTHDGRTAFINSRWERAISQLSIADVRQSRIAKTVRTTTEPWSEQRIRGARLFHNTRDPRMTANRWVSCAVCHLEGGVVSDGVVWDLTVVDARPKVSNTMDLWNTAGTSPPFFHRGTPDAVYALERFVQIFHRGAGFLDDRDTRASGTGKPPRDWDMPADGETRSSPEWAAMLAYMDSLEARANPHMVGNLPRPEIREAVGRGRTLFFDSRVGCGRCHAGRYLTVSGTDQPAMFDVGTGKKIDVPALLHLWDTAGYLHDGRAKTLLDVLTTHNSNDRHGRTSHLSEQELSDLVHFLLAPCVASMPESPE